jgi:hypothetical protein
MPLARLGGVDPVGMTVQGSTREQPRRERQGGYPRPQSPGKRLIAAALPNADPDRYEVLYMLAADGSLAEILIRDIASGAEVARMSPEDLDRIFQQTESTGLLFESKG